jgi:hypothetical protein
MASPVTCPKCQSANTAHVKRLFVLIGRREQIASLDRKGWLSKINGYGPLRPDSSGLRVCLDCAHIWERPAPSFMFIIGLLVGLGLLVPGSYVIIMHDTDPGAIFGAVFAASLGCPALYHSVRAILARACSSSKNEHTGQANSS